MSEPANSASGPTALRNAFSIPRHSWSAPRGRASIGMAVSAADGIKQQVMEAFRALPRRGVETGGLLLGRVVRRDPLDIVINGFEPIPCEHRFGPAFILSDLDRAQLGEILGRPPQQAESSVVGYYRSFTGREIGLDDTDRELVDRHFSAPEQVILAIKPVSFTQCVACWFLRREGHIRHEPGGPPYPFAEEQGARDQQEPEFPAEGEREAESAVAEPVLERRPASSESVATIPAPSPQPRLDPEPARRLRVLPWVLAATAGVAAFAILDSATRRSGAPETFPIGLTAHKMAGGIEVTWDRTIALRRKVTRGLLAINDGNSENRIELDASAVARGHLIYRPSGSDLLLRLSVFGPQKQLAIESLRILGAEPCPLPEAAMPGRAEPPAPQPEESVRAAPKASPAAAEPLPRRAATEPAVEAVPIHEVRPGISEAVQARLQTPLTIPINVRIDAAGKVTGAEVRGDGDALYHYLAERAKSAARFWRFLPARGPNGKPVPSTQTLLFEFRS